MAHLPAKQAAFVREYLVDLNATQAAIRAGYSPKTATSAGSRLLTNVEVSAAIREATEERNKRLNVTQDDVLKGVWAMYHEMIKPVPYRNAKGRIVGYSIPAKNAAVAGRMLELYGRFLSLWNDKQIHQNPDGTPLGFNFNVTFPAGPGRPDGFADT